MVCCVEDFKYLDCIFCWGLSCKCIILCLKTSTNRWDSLTHFRNWAFPTLFLTCRVSEAAWRTRWEKWKVGRDRVTGRIFFYPSSSPSRCVVGVSFVSNLVSWLHDFRNPKYIFLVKKTLNSLICKICFFQCPLPFCFLTYNWGLQLKY